jgi:diacylglycerol kinase (ATP)
VAPDAASTATIVRQAVERGVKALVAVGGDGTVHLALQAIAETTIPLGIIPAGTGNDFAIAVGVPTDPLAAADRIIAAVHEGRTHAVDAVRSNNPSGGLDWWSTVFCSGFDAAVNARANRMRWPRGARRYDLAILAELAWLRPFDFTLELDGEPWRGPAVLVAIGNTATYGGGMRMCPSADPTDGLLDVTIVGPVSRRTLVRVKPQLYDGTHVEHSMVHTRRAKRIVLTAPGATSYADGEPLGNLPLTIEVVPGALQLLGP